MSLKRKDIDIVFTSSTKLYNNYTWFSIKWNETDIRRSNIQVIRTIYDISRRKLTVIFYYNSCLSSIEY